jgi:hypothetical protein
MAKGARGNSRAIQQIRKRKSSRKGLLLLDGPLQTPLKRINARPFFLDGLWPKVDTLETIILQNKASWYQRGTVEGLCSVKKVCTVAT